jgi:hypothetical protein
VPRTREEQEDWYRAHGRIPGEYVFTALDGGPMSPDYLTQTFTQLVREAGRVQVGADGSDPLTLRPLGRRQMISGWGASGQQHELPVGASAEAR